MSTLSLSIRKVAALGALAFGILGVASAQAATPTVFSSGALLGPAPAYALTTNEGGPLWAFSTSGVWSFQWCNLCDGSGQNGLNYGPGFFIQFGTSYGYAVGHFGVAMSGPTATKGAYTPDGTKYLIISIADWAAVPDPRTFTVLLTDGTASSGNDPTTDSTAKHVCLADVVEPVHGQSAASTDANGVHGSGSGLVTFKMPLSSFKCNKGKLSDLSKITTVGAMVEAAKNYFPDGNGQVYASGVVIGQVLFE